MLKKSTRYSAQGGHVPLSTMVKRLGGYVAVGQLLELDGFPEEALPYFSVVHPHTEKLNLNTLTLAQLRRHPYINFYQARANMRLP